ncbi:MAG TPA: phosphopantetheine-binding protein, partial [archaeon]|nr:phosphopantetheine-binding protein [archaeon]
SYMVPATFVILEALPRLANGKLDYRALPAPDAARPALSSAFVAPRSPLEEVLVGLWAQILGLERLGIHDNFFELGGHSLRATQVVSRVRETLGVEVPLRRFFEAPTVEGLALILQEDPLRCASIERTARAVLRVAQLSDEEVDRLLEEKVPKTPATAPGGGTP